MKRDYLYRAFFERKPYKTNWLAWLLVFEIIVIAAVAAWICL